MRGLFWVYGSVDLLGAKMRCDGGIRIGDREQKKTPSYLYVRFLWLGGVSGFNVFSMRVIHTG